MRTDEEAFELQLGIVEEDGVSALVPDEECELSVGGGKRISVSNPMIVWPRHGAATPRRGLET